MILHIDACMFWPVIQIIPDVTGEDRTVGVRRRATKRAIARELYFALAKRGMPDELLAIVGSWGDTLDDAQTLERLRTFNRNGLNMS
jgi:hypothetical protein